MKNQFGPPFGQVVNGAVGAHANPGARGEGRISTMRLSVKGRASVGLPPLPPSPNVPGAGYRVHRHQQGRRLTRRPLAAAG